MSMQDQIYLRAIRLGRLVPKVVEIQSAPLTPSPPIAIPIQDNNVIEAPIPVTRPYLVYREYPTGADVFKIVCEFYGVKQIDVKSERRNAVIVKPRQAVMFLLRTMTTLSFPAIGRLVGHRDHTTILHGCRKISRLIESDERVRDEIDLLKIRISEFLALRNGQTLKTALPIA